ncbi:GNAT family N-acetyltransferase [Halalkalibacter alkalisediminis]|uniref:GNAT family N-acetyltransferase n=1 Tax=Halalkalibacter alkalisediminis TaxID=935616 RepID=A0ABV6NL77_9BACI|nr:GNAT family N-acetyltransferase [Halalkalibacter alkalisediminis]
MRHEDTEQVQDVAKTSWNATYEGIIPLEVQENFLKLAYNDEKMKQRLERSFIFVAEFNGRVIGFANFSPVRDNGKVKLAAIYLYPEYQEKGIGSALLRQGIKDLDGIKEIYINVEKDNKIGKAFYDAKSFKVVKEFDDDFDGHILKTVLVQKPLARNIECQFPLKC